MQKLSPYLLFLNLMEGSEWTPCLKTLKIMFIILYRAIKNRVYDFNLKYYWSYRF